MQEKNRFPKAIVMFGDKKAGLLEKKDDGYVFSYDEEYVKNNPAISVSLPKEQMIHRSTSLFPFFSGLLPEGWYLNLVSKKLKIDKEDGFGLLVATCQDTAGAVSIRKEE
jgi:serine/threonine-protein kinase HipA